MERKFLRLKKADGKEEWKIEWVVGNRVYKPDDKGEIISDEEPEEIEEQEEVEKEEPKATILTVKKSDGRKPTLKPSPLQRAIQQNPIRQQQ